MHLIGGRTLGHKGKKTDDRSNDNMASEDAEKRLTEYLAKLDVEISALKLLLLKRFNEVRKRNIRKG
ncbi:hypothetical protein T265_09836 [Opisthorchis viverrini]|uniref:Uncharacterized protein n=1 Tax=Opisthorchis viverrini TaxID=6198 RepID=A0A074Z8Q7_OPIVI|nr:hypothetical protein T265_09836 [Opisthorchis viverrini]KER21967.1 hypothetical protein T265_09836 [Opisthorchis viverrini]